MNKNKAIAWGFVSMILGGIMLLMMESPALAHHPYGGKIPSNFAEGFLSGLGHPVVGIDHLVFVVAVGLLAVLGTRLSWLIPVSFILTTVLGTLIHLQSVDLPAVELIIAASVLVMGVFLAQEQPATSGLLATLAAIAGIFHGYAYGESIIGAETTVLLAYLLGFGLIQLAISLGAWYLGRSVVRQPQASAILLRFAGFVVCGVGFTLVSNLLIG